MRTIFNSREPCSGWRLLNALTILGSNFVSHLSLAIASESLRCRILQVVKRNCNAENVGTHHFGFRVCRGKTLLSYNPRDAVQPGNIYQ